MNSIVKNTSQIFGLFGLFFTFVLFSFTSKTLPSDWINSKAAIICTDTLITPAEIVDTIITYDKETVAIVRRTTPKAHAAFRLPNSADRTGIDTLIIFDPKTFEETVIIINNDTGTRDTIQYK